MKVSEFERASEVSCVPINAEVRTSLSEIEQRLCDSLMRVEVRGKFGKRVAILLTPDMIENIRTLLRYRKAANVDQTEYLFARPGNAQHPYRGPDVLRELCNNCNLEYTDTITWTGLRKHVATIAQVMEITETMQDQLAGFLGHDIRIHRDFYRLTLSVLQKSKVAQILLKASSQEDFKELEKSPKEWRSETGDVLVPEEEKGEIENEEIKTGKNLRRMQKSQFLNQEIYAPALYQFQRQQREIKAPNQKLREDLGQVKKGMLCSNTSVSSGCLKCLEQLQISLELFHLLKSGLCCGLKSFNPK